MEGDNPPASTNSRQLGPVPIREIRAVAVALHLPASLQFESREARTRDPESRHRLDRELDLRNSGDACSGPDLTSLKTGRHRRFLSCAIGPCTAFSARALRGRSYVRSLLSLSASRLCHSGAWLANHGEGRCDLDLRALCKPL